jgi:hypothetical protein
MSKKGLFGAMLATLMLLFAPTAMAQDGEAARNALRSGQSALSFATPSGGNPIVPGTLGYHYMLADNMRLGVHLGLNMQATTVEVGDEEESATALGLTLAPQLNYYTSTQGTVAPYFFGLLNLGIFSDGIDETTGDPDDDENAFNPQEQPTLNIAAGMGAEWFPVTRFSISGQVGLNIAALQQDQSETEKNDFGLNLFTSSLAANIYF